MAANRWSRDELILAFNLYCKTPFGRIHLRNPEIIALAKILGRSPSAVSWKLANFASLDPYLKKRHIAGASHGSKLDEGVWNEFSQDWDGLAFESERLLADRSRTSVESTAEIDTSDLPPPGKEREAMVRVRVNQTFFRKAVLAAYDYQCCITGLAVPELLVASHIVPWSRDAANRVNPRNGLLLNALHDKAFDLGLLTITPKFVVKVSPGLLKKSRDGFSAATLLAESDGARMRLPQKFVPDAALLRYHNRYVYRSR